MHFKSNFRKHFKVSRAISTRFKCGICHAKFDRYKDLRCHKILKHKDKKHICRICNKSFAHFGSLHKHIESHSKIRLQCAHCDKWLGRPHMRRHLLHFHVPLDCKIIYKRKNLLIKHKKTNDKKVQCPQCNISIRSIYLTTHIKNVHSNNKFTCQICDKIYKLKASLRSHVKAKHNN